MARVPRPRALREQRLDLPHPAADRRHGRRRAGGRGAAPQPDLGLARALLLVAAAAAVVGALLVSRGGRRGAGVGAAVRDAVAELVRGGVAVISLRYHAVSIAAVFLALAVGRRARVERGLGPGARGRIDPARRPGRAGDPAVRRAGRAGRAGAGGRRVRLPRGAGRGARAAGRDRRSRSSSRAPTPQDRDGVVGLIEPGRRDGHGPGRADRRRRRPGARGPVARADLPAAAGGRAAARGVGHGQPGGRPARRGPAGPRRA